jgi:ArsR family transcriptional regulator
MKQLPVLAAPAGIACCTPLAADLEESAAAGLAAVFAALGDPTRVRIVSALLRAGDACCVCDLEPELGLSQSTVSYHLKRLIDVGLLEREKRGTFSFYRLAPQAIDDVRSLFA